MTLTRRTAIAVGSVVGALLVASCSGGVGADSGGDSKDGPVTIKLVAAEYSASNTKSFWDAFAKTYNEKTGNTLEVQVISWDNIDEQTSTMIQNSQPPDILNLNSYASYAAEGLLYNSDEVLSQSVKDDILPTLIDYGSYDGKFYGFPDLASARALFYNTDLTKKAGITAPPTTWAELKEHASKIKGTGGGTVGYAMPLGPEESQAEFSMWLFNNGGNWKDGDAWTINSEPNKTALTFMRSMSDEGLTQKNPATTNRADAFDLFKSGKVGMVVGFSPLAADLDKDGKIKYAVAPFPQKDGGASATYGVTDYLMAFKKDGNKEAVKQFYDLYYQKDQINTFIKGEGFLPVTTSGVAEFSSDAKLKPYLDALPNLNLTPTNDPVWDKVKIAVQQNLGSSMTKDPATVLNNLQSVAEKGS